MHYLVWLFFILFSALNAKEIKGKNLDSLFNKGVCSQRDFNKKFIADNEITQMAEVFTNESSRTCRVTSKIAIVDNPSDNTIHYGENGHIKNKRIEDFSTWEECYKAAISFAQKRKKNDFSKTTYVRRNADILFDPVRTVYTATTGKHLKRQVTYFHYIDWKWNDENFWFWNTSSGSVTMFSDKANPRTGDRRTRRSGKLF
jgi:predicted DNA-binding WGR domain protein